MALLAVSLFAVGPVAAAGPDGVDISSDEDSSGSDVGDTLNSTTDSTGSDDGSTDESGTDSTSGDSAGDGDSTTDSSTTTDDSSSDSSTSDDTSSSTESDGSSDDSTDDESAFDLVLSVEEFESTETTEAVTDTVSGTTDDATADTGATGTVTDTADGISEFTLPSLETADGTDDAPGTSPFDGLAGDTTTDVVGSTADTVDTVVDTTVDGVGSALPSTTSVDSTVAIGSTTDAATASTGAPARTNDFADGPRAQASVEAAPSSNVVGFTGEGTTGGSVPAAPATGVALGVGAVAAAAFTRQSAVMPGIAGNLGAVASAGFAPVFGRNGALGRLIRTIAPFRYSRYDDSDPLEHEARSEVFDVVQDTPGAYLSEVSEQADIPLSTARHHIRVLEREDLVSGAKVRGKRRFYPAHSDGLELAAALNDDATASVIDAIARLGAASVSDLSDELGRDPSTISHHLQRLEEDGIIVRERDGRAVMNKLSPEARTALEPETSEAEVAEAGGAMASD